MRCSFRSHLPTPASFPCTAPCRGAFPPSGVQTMAPPPLPSFGHLQVRRAPSRLVTPQRRPHVARYANCADHSLRPLPESVPLVPRSTRSAGTPFPIRANCSLRAPSLRSPQPELATLVSPRSRQGNRRGLLRCTAPDALACLPRATYPCERTPWHSRTWLRHHREPRRSAASTTSPLSLMLTGHQPSRTATSCTSHPPKTPHTHKRRAIPILQA